ncbi:GEVED domain-containing protein [Flavobacterium lindanitolerans]|uniref:GEVED domain-containing protein n=1 Tax=Flavobacterium lindanitolerans TaxID=428988 RepID=UPI0031A6BACC
MQTNYTKTFTLLLLMLIYGTASAQIVNYGFSQSAGTFTDLTNPTLIAEPTSLTGTGAIDDNKYNAVAIPFSFPFNGTSFTALNIHADGFVSFGATSPSGNTPISNSATTFDGAIAAVATDMHALYNIDGRTGSISTQEVGTAPNREFVIQWMHFRPYLSSTSITSYFDWSFQIRLKENGEINIVYDLKVTGTPTSATAQVGLRGATNSDFNNRYSSGVATSNWILSAAGSSNTSSMTCNSTSLPGSGYTFTWVPPSPCVVPASQPTALTFDIQGIIINGSFTAASPRADKYLVLRTPQGTVPNPPQNGTNYATGNNTALNAYVSYSGSNTNFTDNSSSGIQGNTAYTYTVYAINTACTGGPVYNTTAPLTSDAVNCPAPVNQITSANATMNSFVLNWAAPASGNAATFNYVIEVATNSDFSSPVAGSPFTQTSSQTTFLVTGLSSNTKYFYKIKAVSNCSGVYSSTGNISTLCESVTALPYSESFNATDLSCWATTMITGTANWAVSTGTSEVPTRISGERQMIKAYNNSSALLISPLFDFSAQTHELIRMKVWIYRNTNGHATDVVKFHVNTTNSLSGATELLSVSLKTTLEPAVTAAGWYNYTVAIPQSYYAAPFFVIAQGITNGGTSSYGLGIDEFSLEAIANATPPTSITVTTQNSTPAEITTSGGTLQLAATILPLEANQNVTWSITEGNTLATISSTGLLTAIMNGQVKVRATSVIDNTIFGEIQIQLSNQPLVYCTPNFSQGTEPITLVEFAGISNTSPASTSSPAYENFTSIVGNVRVGNTYPIRLKGNTNGSYSGYFKVYIDWNNNGTFEDGEGQSLGYLSNSTGEDAVELNAEITVPTTATIGNVRMRVLKKYQSSTIPACNTDSYGQAEDYTLNIEENLSVGGFDKTNFKLYPNPTNGIVNLLTDLEIKEVKIYNQLGQLVSIQKTSQISLSDVANGIYIFQIDFKNGQTAKQKVIKK